MEEAPAAEPPKPAQVEALAPARYKVSFTASAELREKLERLRSLMRSSVPDGDLAAIIEEAVTEKLERVEARRFGKTKSPRKSVAQSDTSAGSRYIPAAVRRAVVARDGNRCRFVNAAGKRCDERSGLEFHHDEPHGLGGDRRLENIYLLCRTHNAYLAELTYGRSLMTECRAVDRTKRPPPGVPLPPIDQPWSRSVNS